jgi:poly-gamma-glutamate capsule biosynthesis protein CapA/YwtB (metallophosphatase superfamily)
MGSGKMTFTACGDCFITRRLPCRGSHFLEVSSFIKRAEARFANLEITVHDNEGYPSAFSGGTWAKAKPTVLQDIKGYGFNLIGWANNHSMDYTYGGLEATKRYLEQNGFVHAGVGMNLAEASAPAYLDCPSGRVALIAAVSTFHESAIAGEQRRDCQGRPGVNPLRFNEVFVISPEKMGHLKSTAEVSGINNATNLSIKEGFMRPPKEGHFLFGKHIFCEGDKEGRYTTLHERDMARITRSILEAERQADYVIVSIHSHEMSGEKKENPDKFLEEFARKCIDAGAHAVLGHGPHILRGIEIYRNRPIFYSLGNFIFQSETVDSLPADFYQKYNLSGDNNVADALDARTDKDTKGLGANPSVWESVIPLWTMEKGELKEIELYPIELGFGDPRYKRGWPVPAESSLPLKKLAELSRPYSTEILINGLKGKVKL